MILVNLNKETKTCNKCLQTLPIQNFPLRSNLKIYRLQCKPCLTKEATEYRKKYPNYYKRKKEDPEFKERERIKRAEDFKKLKENRLEYQEYREQNKTAVAKYRASLPVEEKQKRDKEGKTKIAVKITKIKNEKIKNNQCTATVTCAEPIISNNYKCLSHWADNFNRTAKRCNYTKVEFKKIIIDLWTKQNGKCAITGDQLIPGVNIHVDHIVPLYRGGNSDPSNLRLIKDYVNKLKGSLLDEEFEEHILENHSKLVDWVTQNRLRRKNNMSIIMGAGHLASK